MAISLDNITVIGSGTMGHGIAHVAALSGAQVQLVDVTAEALERAMQHIRGNLSKGVEKGKLSAEARDAALGRIQTSTSLAEAVSGADLVIEAVPEKLELKRAVLTVADAHAPAGALLASNTSSMSITGLAALTQRPERFVGLHFFNPVPVMSLLEIVTGELTSAETLEASRAFGARIGKECIVIRDSPGFATSRLGIAVAMEAIRMVQEGVGSAEDIDRAMELGYRFPMGPLKLTDLVGLDVRLAITEHLYQELGTDTFRPPQLLKRLVSAGKLGKKSGQGFYPW